MTWTVTVLKWIAAELNRLRATMVERIKLCIALAWPRPLSWNRIYVYFTRILHINCSIIWYICKRSRHHVWPQNSDLSENRLGIIYVSKVEKESWIWEEKRQKRGFHSVYKSYFLRREVEQSINYSLIERIKE